MALLVSANNETTLGQILSFVVIPFGAAILAALIVYFYKRANRPIPPPPSVAVSDLTTIVARQPVYCVASKADVEALRTRLDQVTQSRIQYSSDSIAQRMKFIMSAAAGTVNTASSPVVTQSDRALWLHSVIASQEILMSLFSDSATRVHITDHCSSVWAPSLVVMPKSNFVFLSVPIGCAQARISSRALLADTHEWLRLASKMLGVTRALNFESVVVHDIPVVSEAPILACLCDVQNVRARMETENLDGRNVRLIVTRRYLGSDRKVVENVPTNMSPPSSYNSQFLPTSEPALQLILAHDCTADDLLSSLRANCVVAVLRD